MLSNVNIVIISRSPPGMKSVMHRPLGQTQQRTVAFQVRQIYSAPPFRCLFYRLVMCFSFWISMKRWQTCKSSLSAFDLLRQTCCFFSHSSPSSPMAVSSLMRASCREDNAIQRWRAAAKQAAIVLFVTGIVLARRSHFGVEWLFSLRPTASTHTPLNHPSHFIYIFYFYYFEWLCNCNLTFSFPSLPWEKC